MLKLNGIAKLNEFRTVFDNKRS